jgi:N-acetyl-anhydromuramyl-L-alanine amidase AmpD
MPSSKRERLLAGIVALVVAISFTVVITSDDGTHHRTVTVHVGSKAPPSEVVPILVKPESKKPVVVLADKDQQLSSSQQHEDSTTAPSQLPNAAALDVHEDMRDETPPGVAPATIRRGIENTVSAEKHVLVAPQNPAGAQSYDCRKHYVVNQSALTHRVIGVAMHFTVSGPGSLDAIRTLFNRPSFGASSTFGFELFNHRCEQWVPLDRKAWAQLTANSFYWSIEIISNDRSRASWLSTPAFKDGSLAALVADLLKRAGAPPRLVDPVGCLFLAGVTDHSRLECGNTHWDVGKNFPWDVFMHQVRVHFYGATKPVSSHTRVVCRKYAWFGVPGSTLAKSRSAGQRAKHGERRRYLVRNHIACSAAGVASRR